METEKRKITLGFTNQCFEPGVHICQIYSDEEERHNALINFLVSGIKDGETTACFTEKESEETLNSFFKANGISIKEAQNSGDFTISKTAEIYFENGKFEPERMLCLLKDFYNKSLSENRPGARVIGEMTNEIEHVPGGSRLLEYESKVSLLIKNYPVNAVCQYDARAFDGATIMDVLKVHPYMIVKGSVVHNPFYIQPEEYLEKNNLK